MENNDYFPYKVDPYLKLELLKTVMGHTGIGYNIDTVIGDVNRLLDEVINKEKNA